MIRLWPGPFDTRCVEIVRQCKRLCTLFARKPFIQRRKKKHNKTGALEFSTVVLSKFRILKWDKTTANLKTRTRAKTSHSSPRCPRRRLHAQRQTQKWTVLTSPPPSSVAKATRFLADTPARSQRVLVATVVQPFRYSRERTWRPAELATIAPEITT
jgi:hypothetical protein